MSHVRGPERRSRSGCRAPKSVSATSRSPISSVPWAIRRAPSCLKSTRRLTQDAAAHRALVCSTWRSWRVPEAGARFPRRSRGSHHTPTDKASLSPADTTNTRRQPLRTRERFIQRGGCPRSSFSAASVTAGRARRS